MQLRERQNLVLPRAQHTNHLNPFLPLCFSIPNVITSLVRVATVAWAACRTQHQHQHLVVSKNWAVPPKQLCTLLLHRLWLLQATPD